MSGHVTGFARALAESDRCLVGTWVKIPALETVEILADSGFDFIIIDQEHAPLNLESVYSATVVAQGAGLQVLVRVPDRSGSHLQRLLDSGVDGILVPRVTSAAEAAEAARQMTFSPEGDRGMGITARAGRWGGIGRDAYLAAGSGVMRGVQLEDKDTVANAAEVFAVPHLNGAFLGMGDLQLSSGQSESEPEIQELVDSFLAAADAASIPVGTAVQTAEQVEKAAKRGFSYAMVSNDTGLLLSAAKSVVGEVRSRLGY
jgi:2-keto-3-deoxy-L-rhamnonate aldolase RhmA